MTMKRELLSLDDISVSIKMIPLDIFSKMKRNAYKITIPGSGMLLQEKFPWRCINIELLLVSVEARLVGGTDNTGRLEVKFDEQWGTVGTEGFDEYDALVACRMLGFNGLGKKTLYWKNDL